MLIFYFKKIYVGLIKVLFLKIRDDKIYLIGLIGFDHI